jgi:excisionase family DNA binding protein
MPRTKKENNSKRAVPPAPANGPVPGPLEEVLTLPETAAYLRVPEEAVVLMVREQGLQGRRIGEEWRFLKSAIQDWLRTTPATGATFWETHYGALKGDPYLEELLRDVYKRRGRPETEE